MRLEIYFSHKTSQIYRKCQMHITFDCKQMLCSSLYLLPLQIWIIMMQMCEFIIRPNIQKFIVFALNSNMSNLHVEVPFWYPGETRAKRHCKLGFLQYFCLHLKYSENCQLCQGCKFEEIDKNVKDLHMLQIWRKCVSNHYIYLTFAYQYLSSKFMCLPTLQATAQM